MASRRGAKFRICVYLQTNKSAHTRSNVFDVPFTPEPSSSVALLDGLESIDPDIKTVLSGEYTAQMPTQYMTPPMVDYSVLDPATFTATQQYAPEPLIPDVDQWQPDAQLMMSRPVLPSIPVTDIPIMPATGYAPTSTGYMMQMEPPLIPENYEPMPLALGDSQSVAEPEKTGYPVVPVQWAKSHYQPSGQLLGKDNPDMANEKMQVQAKSRPFVCGYCSRAFSRKHDLERHARVHSGDRPYVCSVCKKGFPRSDALRRHIRVEGDTHAALLRGDEHPTVDKSHESVESGSEAT